MDEEKIRRVLPLMFRQVKIPEQAKEKLRKQLFESRELSVDELELIAAAGNPPEIVDIDKKTNNGGSENG